MKTAAKVFIWIGIILQWYLVYPVVIGAFALKRIKTARSKDELQAFGILTAILCSMLGGILMLCIKNEELIETPAPFSNITEQQTDTVTIEKQAQQPTLRIVSNKNEKNDKVFPKIGIFTTCTLLSICLFFSIMCTIEYDDGYLPLIFNSIQILSFIPILISFCLNKKLIGKTIFILLIVFVFLSFLLIIVTLYSNYEYAYTGRWTYYGYEYDWLDGDCLGHWIIFSLSTVITVTSICLIKFVDKQGQPIKQKTTAPTTTPNTSNIEQELNQLKRMYEINLIEKDEYDKLRLFIISKYYN